MKLDFGLSNEMLGENIPSEWKKYKFGITYSVTLGKDDLETSIAIRNTDGPEFAFQWLFHTYLAVNLNLLATECFLPVCTLLKWFSLGHFKSRGLRP